MNDVPTENLLRPGGPLRTVRHPYIEIVANLPDSSRYDFGDYRQNGLDIVGEGGFGFVVRARHMLEGRWVPVAVKFLKPQAGLEGLFDRELVACRRRMGVEELVGVVKFYDAGFYDGIGGSIGYFTMEWLDGEPLARKIGTLTIAEMHKIAFEVARGTRHLHELRIIHRDLKPSNVICHPRKGAIITDLGIAKVIEYDGTSLADPPSLPSSAPIVGGLTTAGVVLGTPFYAPAEQLAGKGEVSPAADVYALGILLAEMFNGGGLFPEQTASRLIKARAAGQIGLDWTKLDRLNALQDHPLVRLLKDMTAPEEHLRPTAKDVGSFFLDRMK